ncbi:serine/threonine protein kinase [Nonomuraea sp. GTA35]|uniref:serine/threonine protein kinase n=1 Tax=Nonomuraea sp. GTA35 TaxID=1676746 RepID=UPI0035BEC42A
MAEEPAGLGYVVGQEADWPTLEQEVQGRGPFGGAALHRLAIATMTGLTALHRAGVVHGAVSPKTVLLGPQGARLRHPVPEAPAPDEETVEAGALVWSTPEQVDGLPPAPASDLFAWAATMVYAATGRSPFGGGTVTDTVHRLLHGAADLGPLDGELRTLAADCLAAEPGDRPAAEDALLRLLGYSGALDTAIPTDPPPAAGPPPSPPARRRSRVLILTAVAVAVALLSGGVTYVLTGDREPSAASTTPAAPAAQDATPAAQDATPAARATATPAASPPASPPQPTKRIALPSGGTLYEHPGDPVRLVSYRTGVEGGQTAGYARTPGTDTFQRVAGDNTDAVVSPDGRWLAVVNELSVAVTERQEVTITERVTGERFSLPTADAPQVGQFLDWSRDSRRALLTIFNDLVGEDGKQRRLTAGYVILDVTARTSTFVPTTDALDASDADASAPVYHWLPDGTGVMSGYTTPEGTLGARFRDLTGRETRTMHWVGRPIGEEWFSPSGKLFTTTGCGSYTTCIWDTATGDRRATLPAGRTAYAVGWYDDRHLIRATWAGKDTFRITVHDFAGKEVRLLAEMRSHDRHIVNLTFAGR